MALIWQKNKGATLYEIRSAGQSLRLYTNGVFHSQYNKNRPFQGQIWELLALPALLLNEPEQESARYLLLGLGGGALVKLLQQMFPQMRGQGIELEPMHIQLAKRFFKADQTCRLIRADALDWVAQNKQQKFKLVIDDLFGSDGKSQPGRAVTADIPWLEQLQALLDSEGILVMNMESLKQAQDLIREVKKHASMSFQQVLVLRAKHYDNVILAFLSCPCSRAELKDVLLSFRPVRRYFVGASARFEFQLKTL